MDYLPRNIGTHLAIDEVALQGEQYTNVTNKKRLKHERFLSDNCTITMTEQVIEYVSKIDSKKRQAVIEITRYINSMKLIAKNVFQSHMK
jgi:hypothetical protein